MPPIKFAEIISFSSEDPKYPADNLLKPEQAKKWKCIQSSTEKQASVTIKLEKLTTIRSIDIGNEGSAFVEVLASREGTDFKVILVASSFMSPLESRNEKELGRVRMFGPDKLSKEAGEQKWDRIKVVCTQPFNKSIQYGLSFIKVIATGQSQEIENNSKTVTKIGSFSIKDDDEDDNQSLTGSFFAKRKEVKDEPQAAGPAAIRAASAAIVKSTTSSSSSLKRKSEEEQKPSKYQKKSTDTSKDTSSKSSSKDKPSSSKNNNKTTDVKNNEKKSTQPKEGKNKNTSSSSSSSSATITKTNKHRPFSSLMSNVVFVLSGYKNPLRSQLRDKMLEMGASYESDWDPSATHLICAYTNTPKYKVVQGKGRIVSHQWIEDSYKNKIKYSWTKYNLEKKKVESDEEIWADEIMPKQKGSIAPPPGEDNYDDKTDSSSDEVDTDDEIENVLRQQKESTKDKNSSNTNSQSPVKNKNIKQENGYTNDNGIKSEDDDVYDKDTDVDEDDVDLGKRPDTTKLKLPPLPAIFTGKTFFLYGTKMGEDLKTLLKRYIIAFDGKVENYMGSDITYVITEDKWDEEFEEALNDNPNVQFIKPRWIWKCSDKGTTVPHQPYLVVPLQN